MTVRCCFVCDSVTKQKHWDQNKGDFLYTAKFSVITADSKEHRAFFEATPAGSLEIGTYKEDVFEVGATYYVDLTKVP